MFKGSVVKIFVTCCLISSVFLPLLLPKTAKAVVPVYCPSPCSVWDRGMSGKNPYAPSGIVGGVAGAVGLGGFSSIFSSIASFFGGSVEGHNVEKEYSFLNKLFTDPLGALKSLFSGSMSWDNLAWMFANEILHQISQATINWIKNPGGDWTDYFSEGTSGSLMITNFDKFLLGVVDNQATRFLKEYDEDAYNLLCSPFKLQVGLYLNRSRGIDPGSFKYQSRCTVTGIVNNLENFYNDFSTGGWATWYETGKYANTAQGLITLSEATLQQRAARAAQASKNEYLAGQGSVGLKACLKSFSHKGIKGCETYKIVSPGHTIVKQLETSMNWDLSRLNLADELNEVLYAAFTETFSWLTSGGSGGGGILGRDDKHEVPQFKDPRRYPSPSPSGTPTGGPSGGTTGGGVPPGPPGGIPGDPTTSTSTPGGIPPPPPPVNAQPI